MAELSTKISHSCKEVEGDLLLDNLYMDTNFSKEQCEQYICTSRDLESKCLLTPLKLYLDKMSKEMQRNIIRIKLNENVLGKLCKSFKDRMAHFIEGISACREKDGDTSTVALHDSLDRMSVGRKEDDLEKETKTISKKEIKESDTEELNKTRQFKKKDWVPGMTKPLTRKMSYNFRGKGPVRCIMGLLIFLLISPVTTECILKKKAITLDKTCTTLTMEVSYSKGCNGKSYRWDWNLQQIYFGDSNEKIGPKYIFQHDRNSSLVRAIINNITSDDLKGQYSFATNLKTIEFVLSNQTIIAHGKWEVRCQDKEIVYNTTVKHPGRNISLAAYLRSADGTNFSQRLDVKVLTTDWNDVMFSSQVMFNGKGGIWIDGLNLDIEVDKEPYFSEPVEVNLTHLFLTKCKGSKTNAKVTGNHLAITIGLSIGILIVAAVFLSIIGWFCLKRKMGKSFVSLFSLCKRDDQDGRNGEEEGIKSIRLLDLSKNDGTMNNDP